MSQSGSESDIWDYKPLKKTKKRSCKSQTSKGHGTKKRKDGNPGASVQKTQVSSSQIWTDLDQNCNNAPINTTNSESVDVNHGTLSQIVHTDPPQSGGFCPVCQMPFSLLVVQSQQWHVAECLDNPGDNGKECPDGLHCTSTIPNHYKRFNHFLLAQSRALNDSTVQPISDLGFKSVNDVGTESSVDNAVNVSASSSQSSGNDGLKGTPIQTNALLFLRSPNTEDIKKKKGWSPSIKKSQSQNSSQEANLKISTPVKEPSVHEDVEFKKELFECNDNDYISYSPLSELPEVDEDNLKQKTNKEIEEEENEINGDDDSLQLFSDEDDDLFYDMMDQYETQDHGPGKNSLDTCEKLQPSLALGSHLTSSSSTGVSDGTFQHRSESFGKSEGTYSQLQSPQSLVLERLREHISNPAHANSLASPYEEVNSAYINQELSSTQSVQSATQNTPSMARRRTQTKAGSSGLKQTDIGVFFGLKPLSEKKTEEEVKALVTETNQQGSRRARISETQGEDARRQGRQRRKSKAPSELSSVSSVSEDGTTQPTQTEGKRGGRAEGRKRWNRGRATDGDPKEPKRCPFYKKIPGTGFAVDAFQYGLVEGITAYFLTHFHSDHYGGLKKDSVFPIYCNKVMTAIPWRMETTEVLGPAFIEPGERNCYNLT